MSKILTSGPLIKNLRLIYLLGLPLGLSPYIINQKGEFYFNKRATCQTFLILIYEILVTLYMIKYLDGKDILRQTGLLRMVISVQHGFWQFLTLFYVFFEYINRTKFLQILQDLQLYDDVKDRFNFNTKMCYKSVRKFIFATHGFVFLALSTVMACDIVNFYRFTITIYNFIDYKSIF